MPRVVARVEKKISAGGLVPVRRWLAQVAGGSWEVKTESFDGLVSVMDLGGGRRARNSMWVIEGWGRRVVRIWEPCCRFL